MFNVITPTPSQWDVFLNTLPNAHLLQTSGWAGLKRSYGWDAARVGLTDMQGNLVAGAQLLFRRLPFRLGTMAYLPFGPVITHHDQRSDLWGAIHTIAKEHRAAFLKWEPGILRAGEAPPNYAHMQFRPSPQTVQPPRTILIDLADDETMLARMNQGTRRKIRQSQKGEVHYYEGSRADVETFTRMMHTTGERNDFGVHEPAYYSLAYDLFVPEHAALFLAEHEGDPLAGIMVFAKGDTAWYLYGASSNIKRNLMAAYGVQWRAIQWARARGCTLYDLWGIPDEDEAALEAQFESREDGLWGVYGFKRGWGGRVARSEGVYDRVYNPLVYAAYRLAVRRMKTE